MLKYLLLMRHGAHEEATPTLIDPNRKRKLSAKGEKDTNAVSKRLDSVLNDLPVPEVLTENNGLSTQSKSKKSDDLGISEISIFHATTIESVETMKIVNSVMQVHFTNEARIMYTSRQRSGIMRA